MTIKADFLVNRQCHNQAKFNEKFDQQMLKYSEIFQENIYIYMDNVYIQIFPIMFLGKIKNISQNIVLKYLV